MTALPSTLRLPADARTPDVPAPLADEGEHFSVEPLPQGIPATLYIPSAPLSPYLRGTLAAPYAGPGTYQVGRVDGVR